MSAILQYLEQASLLLEDRPDAAMLDYAAQVGVHHLGAWCMLYVGDRGTLLGVAAAHVDPGKRPLVQRLRASALDMNAPGGAALAWRTGRCWRASPLPAHQLPDLGWGPDCAGVLRALSPAAAMAVPITLGGTAIGAMVFAAGKRTRPMGASWPGRTVQALAQDLAFRCALAIENARLRQETWDRNRAQYTGLESILSLLGHELRTPLAHIKGFANTLLQEDVAWSHETRQDFIRTIDREADRLALLLSDFLELSYVESGRIQLDLRPVDAGAILAAGVKGAGTALEQHETIFMAPASLPLVQADVPRVERALARLLGHAAASSPPRSRIELAASERLGDVLFSVADEGPGIPAAARERLFETPFRLEDVTERNGRGARLGLALCKAIVQAHGGRIWVEGREGRGSRVCFTLPAGPGAGVGQEPSEKD